MSHTNNRPNKPVWMWLSLDIKDGTKNDRDGMKRVNDKNDGEEIDCVKNRERLLFYSYNSMDKSSRTFQ